MADDVRPQVTTIEKGQRPPLARGTREGELDTLAVHVLKERAREQEAVLAPGTAELLEIRRREVLHEALRRSLGHARHVGRQGRPEDLV